MQKQDIVHSTYIRLLTDVEHIVGVPLGSPIVTDDWLFKEGPQLDKDLLNYLEGRGDFPLFPTWLHGLATIVRDDDNKRALSCLRTLLLFCYKVEQSPTTQQLENAYEQFKQTDRELQVSDLAIANRKAGSRLDHLLRRAKRYASQVIAKCNFRDITPSHGPGAVFPPKASEMKSDFTTIYSSIQRYYDYCDYMIGLPNYWDSDVWRQQDRISESDTIVANLIAVPKDSRGPRLICVHPSEAIWIQQGQRRVLERAIQCSPLFPHIRFDDQSINGAVAMSSSIDRSYFTIDLAEASDRISCVLAREILGGSYDILSCTRASHVRFPDGSLCPILKWAPMGNALCFPVETLIFGCLVKAITDAHFGGSQTDVFVFGDDILAPSNCYSAVIDGLSSVGLKVNTRKSFVTGFFRESCGVDAYKGFDVTPYRLKVGHCHDLEEVVSLLDLAKRLRLGGYDFTSSYLYSLCRRRVGYLPLVNNINCTGICEYVEGDLGDLMLREPRLKWHSPSQQWIVPHRQVTTRKKAERGYRHNLLDSILSASLESDRGLQYPVPYTARLTYGWTPVIPSRA